MWRILIGLFLVAHGLVIVGIYGPTYPAVTQGQLPTHSWIFGDVRAVSLIFGVAVGLALALAGFGLLTHQSWWPPAAIAAGVGSLLLFAVFFSPWCTVRIAISTTLIIAALRTLSPA